jgi:predicted nucleotidyltransferase
MRRWYLSELSNIQRTQLLAYMQALLESHPHVYALWLEGADARNKVDEFSDIDLWLDVEDGHEENVLQMLEHHLQNFASLDMVYKKPAFHPHIKQWFFHFANTSEFLILDVCVQSHSREIAFGPGDSVKVLFDKEQVIRFENIGRTNLVEQAKEIQAEVALYKIWVLKAIRRGHWLEATSYYHECILGPLSKVLRLEYTPHKAEYAFKHSDEDLPNDVVVRLGTLTKVTSWKELGVNLEQAVVWLDMIVEKIEPKNES